MSFLDEINEPSRPNDLKTGGGYIFTDTSVSRNLLYGQLNKTDRIYCEYSFYSNDINEFMLSSSVKNVIGEDKLYFSEFGFPGRKSVISEEDWDDGNYIFVLKRKSSGYDLIHKKNSTVYFLSESPAAAKKLRETYTKKINEEIAKLTKVSYFNDKISLLMKSDSYYFTSVKINIDNVKNLDLNLHYGAGFDEKNKAILNNLEKGNKGLTLIHGTMGSGKTTYLRYLTSRISNKKVIFIPPYFTDFLSAPEFLPTLVSDSGARNSILVIEDAEKVVMSREDGNINSNCVSSILNLSDGIMSDIAQISIIATFNTKVENIDKALLRKGRLVAEHTFNALSISDSQKLIDKLAADGIIQKFKATKEMTLAEIYGAEQDNFHEEKVERKIGFGR